MKTTIYLECTNTYATEVLTGIQRVVRNVIQAAAQEGQALDCHIQPVIIVGDKFYAVEGLPQHNYQNTTEQSTSSVKTILQQVKTLPKLLGRLTTGLLKATMRSTKFEAIKNRFRHHFPHFFTWLKHKYLQIKLMMNRDSTQQAAPVEFHEGDILFMLDSSWMPNVWSALASAHQQQARIIFNVYDLIPLQYPQFCDEDLIRRFTHYYQQAAHMATGFMAISAAVRDEVIEYLSKHHLDINHQAIAFDYFHLGADFRLNNLQQSVRSQVVDVFAGEDPVFLMVSTIEPRKNHAYLLDAFDQLWQQGLPVKLLIVGRVGWKVEQLMSRLMSHPQLNTQLFLRHDLTDAELSYCYEHATALVFPSITEGFGLPVIEAFQHGLPVIASDIPVHREIAGELAYYVNLDDARSLVSVIQDIQQRGVAADHLPGDDYHWLSWQEATRLLLQKLLKMASSTQVNS